MISFIINETGLFALADNQFGALAVLLSPSTQRVVAGEDAVFIYRIALADNQNVVDNIGIGIINSEVSTTELSTIIDQGNDIYHVTFSNVSVLLNQAEFVLQFNEATISNTATIAVLCKLIKCDWLNNNPPCMLACKVWGLFLKFKVP